MEKKQKNRKDKSISLLFPIILVFCILGTVVFSVSHKISAEMSHSAIQNLSESLDLMKGTIEAILLKEAEFQKLISHEIANIENPEEFIRSYHKNQTMVKLSIILSGETEGISNTGEVFTEDELNFSFSGLKSAVINLRHNEEQRGNEIRKYDLARSFQDVAFDQVIRKTRLAIERYDIKRVIVAGGVSASKNLRELMQELCQEMNVDLSIPPMRYCTDNATMIAAAAYYAYQDGRKADLYLNSKSNDRLC